MRFDREHNTFLSVLPKKTLVSSYSKYFTSPSPRLPLPPPPPPPPPLSLSGKTEFMSPCVSRRHTDGYTQTLRRTQRQHDKVTAPSTPPTLFCCAGHSGFAPLMCAKLFCLSVTNSLHLTISMTYSCFLVALSYIYVYMPLGLLLLSLLLCI